MTTEQFWLLMLAPIGGLLIAAVLMYVTRGDRKPPHPHPGE